MRMTSKTAVSRLMNGAVIGLLCSQGNSRRSGLARPGPTSPGQSGSWKPPGNGSLPRRSTFPRPSHSAWPAWDCCTLARPPTPPSSAFTKRPRRQKRLLEATPTTPTSCARQATLAVEPTRIEMERARTRFLNRPLVAYDLTQHGKFTFNTLTGAFRPETGLRARESS